MHQATATMSRLAQNKFVNETEERLLECALTLFAAQGYHATTVREIIEAAGVTRPVLYYYCDNKEDLFKRVVHWTHDDPYDELERLLAETTGPVNQLRTIIRGTFLFCASDSRIPQLMFQITYGSAASALAEFMNQFAQRRFSMIVRVIQQGIDAGDLRPNDAASLALLFCSIMDYHVSTLSRLPDPARTLTCERADSLVDAFLYGVGVGRRGTPQLPPLSLAGVRVGQQPDTGSRKAAVCKNTNRRSV
jgi:AcrR family transcriptional regulator